MTTFAWNATYTQQIQAEPSIVLRHTDLWPRWHDLGAWAGWVRFSLSLTPSLSVSGTWIKRARGKFLGTCGEHCWKVIWGPASGSWQTKILSKLKLWVEEPLWVSGRSLKRQRTLICAEKPGSQERTKSLYNPYLPLYSAFSGLLGIHTLKIFFSWSNPFTFFFFLLVTKRDYTGTADSRRKKSLTMEGINLKITNTKKDRRTVKVQWSRAMK